MKGLAQKHVEALIMPGNSMPVKAAALVLFQRPGSAFNRTSTVSIPE
jgi:hypothetical protein